MSEPNQDDEFSTNMVLPKTTPFREWLTCREIGALALPGYPASERGVAGKLAPILDRRDPREVRPRKGRGGGFEYHCSVLQPDALNAYEARNGIGGGWEPRGEFKEWLNAREIAELALPGIATTKVGVKPILAPVLDRRDPREVRPRAGRGGGFEYHCSVLPADALEAYEARNGIGGDWEPRGEFKEWLNAREIAELSLPGMPTTEYRVRKSFERREWRSCDRRERIRSGSPGGFEYYYAACLPWPARRAYECRGRAVASAETVKLWFSAGEMTLLALPGAPRTERGMLDLLKRRSATELHLCRLRRARGGGCEFHIHLLPDDWTETYLRNGSGEAARSRPVRQIGKGKLASLNDGKVQSFILRAMLQRPTPSPKDMRALCLHQFGEMLAHADTGKPVAMPSVATFRRFMSAARSEVPILPAYAYDKATSRRGKTVIADAEDGELRRLLEYILGRDRGTKPRQLRRAAIEAFGPTLNVMRASGPKTVSVPSTRSFEIYRRRFIGEAVAR